MKKSVFFEVFIILTKWRVQRAVEAIKLLTYSDWRARLGPLVFRFMPETLVQTESEPEPHQ